MPAVQKTAGFVVFVIKRWAIWIVIKNKNGKGG